ncbi:AraC family transcriptional regulator [Pseudomonas chlororaphis]|jgi:AraC-like DNA-binding protein|uniref:Helix-turn-helix transcriptional regulator n=1 Tax=Pseudomonas morbosilactucae TaxID=2938197 RepID=A0A9X2C530_9PSED|nr:helix-turn-helix transcriptional regulator [Pseudomonas morbosilactucae]MCK9797616.1 helix-turn-helix transcriptional regulator [Pseudomonas morbosilactucae]MCK9814165.1 helix-turn-helix transcriptional regulator [Pseudomonas morbosilactucae]ROL72232.1 AraC family transcriptional regulator [Pseudomonas chlororaphis]WEK08728.1 MAG: helix-turn-helix transcriptional regulator [Pseudomonas sp.]
MRNTSINLLDQTPRPVVAIGTDYPDGHLLPRHQHRRGQLLYGATGVMQVSTEAGNWVVPPQRAVWIAPQVPHAVLMLGVSTRSLYIEPDAVPFNEAPCRVLNVSPLMRQLLLEAVDIPLEYETHGRDGVLISLLLHELGRSTPLPLHIPLPAEPRLLALCQAFLQQPDIHQSPQQWAQQLHASLRTFNRWFRQQTGMSFVQWRQRACVVLALARLAAGEAVTRIAMDFGYDSPAAFSTMFRRVLGQAPTAYLHSAA